MDILTGNGRSIQKKDFSSDWNLAPRLGKVEAADDFLINGQLGGTNRQGKWDISDRIKFSLLQPLALNLSLDPQTIAEVVQFNSAGLGSWFDRIWNATTTSTYTGLLRFIAFR